MSDSNDTPPNTLSESELGQIQGGNSSAGFNQHGGSRYLEEQINAWLQENPIPPPKPTPIVVTEMPSPVISDLRIQWPG
jgi:hypothetical protein